MHFSLTHTHTLFLLHLTQASRSIKEECEGILAEAMPALNAAISALATIKTADIRLVQSFKNPPAAVKLVMEAVCVLLDAKPTMVADPNIPGVCVCVCVCVCACACACAYVHVHVRVRGRVLGICEWGLRPMLLGRRANEKCLASQVVGVWYVLLSSMPSPQCGGHQHAGGWGCLGGRRGLCLTETIAMCAYVCVCVCDPVRVHM